MTGTVVREGVIQDETGMEYTFDSGSCLRNGTHFGTLVGMRVQFGVPVYTPVAWVSITPVDLRAANAMRRSYDHMANTWLCGCGHTNGVNLATCAQCGRKPGEKR